MSEPSPADLPVATARAVVRATFNAAVDHFDDPPLFFWDHIGRRTVDHAGVRRGHRVLDVCCGTGASAIPAARRAGPTGHVTGIDLAELPLARARAKASAAGLHNVEFVAGDLTAPDVPDESVDVAICVLGIYFAEDVPAALTGLWRTLRPGGTLAVTTWGRRALEPVHTMYLDAVGERCPRLRPDSVSWERINEPDALRETFAAAGVAKPGLVHETLLHPLSGNDFWTVVLGSGYRLLVELLGPDGAAEVRERLGSRVVAERVHTLTSDVIYARARKPARGTTK